MEGIGYKVQTSLYVQCFWIILSFEGTILTDMMIDALIVLLTILLLPGVMARFPRANIGFTIHPGSQLQNSGAPVGIRRC